MMRIGSDRLYLKECLSIFYIEIFVNMEMFDLLLPLLITITLFFSTSRSDFYFTWWEVNTKKSSFYHSGRIVTLPKRRTMPGVHQGSFVNWVSCVSCQLGVMCQSSKIVGWLLTIPGAPQRNFEFLYTKDLWEQTQTPEIINTKSVNARSAFLSMRLDGNCVCVFFIISQAEASANKCNLVF